MSLTDAGRELREEAFEMDLVAATGLSLDELKTMQRGVSTLQDNLRNYLRDNA